MENTLGQRFTEVLYYYGITESELAKITSISKQTLNNIIKIGNPTFETIERIIKHFTMINARWLLTGDGTMLDDTFVSEPDTQYGNKQVLERLWIEDRRELIRLREMNHNLMEELITVKKDCEKKEAG